MADHERLWREMRHQEVLRVYPSLETRVRQAAKNFDDDEKAHTLDITLSKWYPQKSMEDYAVLYDSIHRIFVSLGYDIRSSWASQGGVVVASYSRMR
jgi:hypothetical protein